MLITQSNSVDTGSILDALCYCGKQLYKSSVVITYFVVLVLALDLFCRWSYSVHPEWEEQHAAEREARWDAEEQAYKLKRLAEEKEQMLEAKHASLTQ